MQPPANYFDFFGLPHKLNLDGKDLESRFYALSKQWHPDRFARGSEEQKRISENATATLNDGYRTLRDPVARAEYLLKEHGLESGEQKKVPPELLEEVFELNMALEEGELEEANRMFTKMRDEIDEELQSQFTAYDEGKPVLEQIRLTLNRRKYISNLVKQASSKVGQAVLPAGQNPGTKESL